MTHTDTRRPALDAVHPGSLLFLSRADVEALDVPLAEVRAVVEAALLEKGRGLVESPPKRGVVPRPGCSIRAMKAHVPSLGTAAVKWISAYPSNVERGLPTIAGLLVLNEAETGQPIAVMDCAWITAARTAACTAVTVAHLARADTGTLGIIACGLQGRRNLEAVAAELPIRHVRAYDVRPEAARTFAERSSAALGIEVEPVGSAVEAARDRDLVIASAPIEKTPDTPVGAGVLAPGALAVALDFDASFRRDALREADRFVVDDVPQVAFFKDIGYLEHAPEPDADLGKVVAGRQPGRTDGAQRIVAMNLGIGVLDAAVGTWIYRRARERGAGIVLSL